MRNLTQTLTDLDSGLIVYLTGAGISAESGIPTFRGTEGYWTVGSTNYHPSELATNRAFSADPETVWSWYLYRHSVCRRAAPNAGHQTLAELEAQLQDRFILVTQNVDGLHLRAGNTLERTYQIHGNINFMRCFAECCPDLTPIPDKIGDMDRGGTLTDDQRELLRCSECNGWSRPHVLWFDEIYDESRFFFESSLRAASECRALITVGSSGSTNLPHQMARAAARNGALLIDINPEPNPFAALSQESGGVWLQQRASEGLNHLAQAWRAA